LKAYAFSKGIDTDNWEITEADFQQLSAMFGPFSVDLFATRVNAKCAKFFTRLFKEGNSGVDCFSQDWTGKCIYAAPPVLLVLRTIRKAATSVMSGVLLIPLWKNARFWTFAFRDGVHLNVMLEHVKIVRMHKLAWEFGKKDLINGKRFNF
jgi:hypothetical protein